MKDVPKPKIKVKVRPPVPKGGTKPTVQEEPIQQQKPKRKKGLIRKIVEIVSKDIRNLPNKLWGEKKKKVIMPESKESWKDWEGEI